MSQTLTPMNRGVDVDTETNADTDTTLDLLADLVAAAHVDTLSARGWYAGRWNLRFSASEDRGFHVVAAGHASLRLDDGSVHRLSRGDIALVSVPHELASDLDCAPIDFSPRAASRFSVPQSRGETCLLCGAYVLRETTQHPVFSSLPPLILLRAGDRDPAIDAMVEILDGEFQGTRPGGRTIAARLIDAMLVYILRHWIDSDCPTALGWLKALRDPVLARALALMHGDYARDWSLDTLAHAAGTSRASLARRFSSEIGASPMHYLTQLRLEAAKTLLTSTSMSLDEIAARVGYASAFSLSKAFKRAFGEAPRHFAAP